MTQEEQALVQALHRGDRYACQELVEKYAGKIYNVALRLTGHPQEAEEVLQETFINACQGVEKFEGRSSLGTWLYRIAANNGLMRLRKKEAPTVPLETAPDPDVPTEFWPRQLQDWAWEPEQVALTDELRQVMEEAVQKLPEPLRMAFILRDIEGLSTREAAEALEISPGNLKVRLHRARLLLREELASYFHDHPNGGQSRGTAH
ncbi:MAG: sigma-70 family RNA polymerase sigma factor [Chloroflexi bacterium]|nr:MAG: sigma-70 family RNA polymerase sigma factor [Chloroflexota bacterium]